MMRYPFFHSQVLAFVTAVCLGLVMNAAGQGMATIVGTVRDQTGAVISGAKVTVSNPAKGYIRSVKSNSAGAYEVAALPIGNYMVAAEAKGFQRLVQTGISLSVGQVQRVDLELHVGAETQEVTVRGNLPHVQTETAAVSSLVTGKQITQLMLNGRNFTDLYQLVPGVVMDNSYDPTQVGITGFAAYSINGNRMEYNNIEYDGSGISDEGSGGSSVTIYPSLESIAEFRITTSNYGADQGKHGAGQIELVSKSGTKQFHGEVYEFVRNDAFDANDWFINQTVAPPGGKAPKVPLKWNDYGYTIGGPFYIPHHYNTTRSKTFFFWSEEWRRYRQGTVLNAGVPSVLERQGGFSQCDPGSTDFNSAVASGCVLPAFNGTSYDTVQQMPNFNQQAFINATDLLNAYFPMPNNGPANWVSAPSVPTNWRDDQIISEKAHVFVRFTHDAWDTVSVPSLWSWASYDTIETPFNGPSKAAVVNMVYNFEPNLLNEFVAGYYEDWIYLNNRPGPDSVAHSINQPSNWVANHLFAPNAGNPLLPAVAVCGGVSFCTAEDAGNHPWTNSNPIVTLRDDVTYLVGNHTVKFWMYYTDYRKNEQFGFDTQGFLNFANSGPITSGNALADMFLGNINSYQEGTEVVNGVPVGGYPKGHWRYMDYEPYVQDNWKARKNLSLTFGVRFYHFTPWHDVSSPVTVDATFLPQAYNPAQAAQLDSNGNLVPGSGFGYTNYGNGLVKCGQGGGAPSSCQANHPWQVAPRFGFSWDPTGHGKTVIRGGYGLYYEPGNGNEANPEGMEGNPPVAFAPSGFNIVGYSNITPGVLGPTNFVAIPLHQHYPTVQQYSFDIQHQFTINDLLTIGYVGTQGRDLARSVNFNQIPDDATTAFVPQLAGSKYCDSAGNCNVQATLINEAAPNNDFFYPYHIFNNPSWMKEYTALSNYNSLQIDYRHSFSHGLTFQVAYTWSHTLDNSTSTYNEPTDAVDDTNLKRWYATSDLNRAEVLTMNYIYNLPFFSHSSHRFLRNTLGGWELSGITTFFTGEPITGLTCSIAGFATGIGATGLMCNTAPGFGVHKGTVNDPTFGPVPTWFDPSKLLQPMLEQLPANGEPGMFGYMGRNALTGPGRNNWDLGLYKNFVLPWFSGEHSTLQFRWETFNTFNHPQWKGINAFCSSETPPGTPCNGPNNVGNGEVSSDWGPRLMQFAMKLSF